MAAMVPSRSSRVWYAWLLSTPAAESRVFDSDARALRTVKWKEISVLPPTSRSSMCITLVPDDEGRSRCRRRRVAQAGDAQPIRQEHGHLKRDVSSTGPLSHRGGYPPSFRASALLLNLCAAEHVAYSLMLRSPSSACTHQHRLQGVLTFCGCSENFCHRPAETAVTGDAAT